MYSRHGLWLAGFLGACASGAAGRLDGINDSLSDLGSSPPTAVDPLGDLKALDRTTYVRLVLRRHPSLRAAKEAVTAALARVSQSRAFPDPMLSFGLAPLSVGADQVPFGGSIELRQRLPNLPQLSLLEERETLRAEISRDEAEAVRRALASEAASAFDDYELIRSALLVNRHYVELIDAMKLSAESDYAAGRAPVGLAAEVEMEGLRLQREQLALRAEEGVALAKLNILLGRPSDAALPPLEPAPPRTAVASARSEAAWEERALAARPEIRRAARGLLEGGLLESIASWAPWPELELMTSYNSMWHDPEHRWMVGLGLSLPINISSLRGMKDEAAAEARGAQHQLEAMALEVRAEVAFAHQQLVEIEAALELYEKRMRPLAEERRDLVRAGVDAAVEDYRSLLEAERTVRQVELEILGMQREAARRRTALSLAAGEVPGTESEGGQP